MERYTWVSGHWRRLPGARSTSTASGKGGRVVVVLILLFLAYCFLRQEPAKPSPPSLSPSSSSQPARPRPISMPVRSSGTSSASFKIRQKPAHAPRDEVRDPYPTTPARNDQVLDPYQ